MKILVLGDGEHGKGTLCKRVFKIYGMTAKSSSEFACEKFVYNQIKDEFNYSSIEECYADRREKRELWYKLITGFNTPKLHRLAEELLKDYDIYDGMRNIDEFNACMDAKIFDLIIWVDASERLPTEGSSMTIPKERADIIITNNASEEDFLDKVDRLFQFISLKMDLKPAQNTC